jgi:type IV secretion system protein VirB9
MKRILLYSIIWVAGLAGMGGCASRSPEPEVVVGPDTRLVPAQLQPDSDLPSRVVEVPVPVPSPQLRFWPQDGTATTARPSTTRPTTQPSALDAIRGAKSAATTQPTPDGFLEAVQYYDYAPGTVYTAVTSPGFVTTVALRPGETLVTAAAGDTTRWILDPVETGSGASKQTLLLVKPRKPYLDTNLVITTDQRVYNLDLISVDSPVYHTMIAWHYPFGDVIAIRSQTASADASREATVARGLDLNRLNFNYLVLKQKGPTPRWAPLRAFDDGQKTYIEFPPAVGVTEAPPLFVLGLNGDAQLVNYRIRGRYYVVDKLFDRAELRIGEAPQAIVRIQRAEPKDNAPPVQANAGASGHYQRRSP